MIKFKCENCETESKSNGLVFYRKGKRVTQGTKKGCDLILCPPCDFAVSTAIDYYVKEYPCEFEDMVIEPGAYGKKTGEYVDGCGFRFTSDGDMFDNEGEEI